MKFRIRRRRNVIADRLDVGGDREGWFHAALFVPLFG
jgi:hypothetical protein